MADDSGIDPRYAAQFQRGFDPARHAVAPARSGPLRLEGGPPATAERVPDPPRFATATTEHQIAEGVEPPADELTAVEPAPPGPLTRWDWLLPGIGVALMLVAFGMWGSLGTDGGAYFGTGASDNWGAFWHHLRFSLPAPLLTAGAVALTAGIVLQAVRPRS